eukprot:929597-Prymnesium_polylepis.2
MSRTLDAAWEPRAGEAMCMWPACTFARWSRLGVWRVRRRAQLRKWDSNGNGVVEYEEFRTNIRELGLHATDEEIAKLFGMLDDDGSVRGAFSLPTRRPRAERDQAGIAQATRGGPEGDRGGVEARKVGATEYEKVACRAAGKREGAHGARRARRGGGGGRG